jgi:hypothetical protein
MCIYYEHVYYVRRNFNDVVLLTFDMVDMVGGFSVKIETLFEYYIWLFEIICDQILQC